MFSAVMPMWQSSKGSVSAPTVASTTMPSPIRCPQRSAGTQYWPRLMLSAPPATATSASPSMTSWAAETMAWSPEPQSRLRVKAGVSAGRPPLMAATRDRYMSWTSVWMTWPNTTCPTSDAPTPERFTASRTTVAASSVGGWSLRLPPYLPIAVRTALRTTTSRALSISRLRSGRPLGRARTTVGGQGVRAQHLHVVGALESRGLPNGPVAHAALHLLDGLVLVRLHPGQHPGAHDAHVLDPALEERRRHHGHPGARHHGLERILAFVHAPRHRQPGPDVAVQDGDPVEAHEQLVGARQREAGHDLETLEI